MDWEASEVVAEYVEAWTGDAVSGQRGTRKEVQGQEDSQLQSLVRPNKEYVLEKSLRRVRNAWMGPSSEKMSRSLTVDDQAYDLLDNNLAYCTWLLDSLDDC